MRLTLLERIKIKFRKMIYEQRLIKQEEYRDYITYLENVYREYCYYKKNKKLI